MIQTRLTPQRTGSNAASSGPRRADWTGACELWQEACEIHPKGYAIHYLLGVCAETSGDLEDALKHYQKADRLTGEPVKEINEALGRVRVLGGSGLGKEKRLEQLQR